MTVVYSPIKVRVEDGEILDVEITFEEHQLKAICGNEVIENIEEQWIDSKPVTMKQ